MNYKLHIINLLFLALVRNSPGSVPVPAPEQHQPIALVGGSIHPVSGPAIENGAIFFDKGKIRGVI